MCVCMQQRVDEWELSGVECDKIKGNMYAKQCRFLLVVVSVVFSTLWYDDGDDMNLIGSVCQNWFHSNLNVSQPLRIPSSTELYIFKFAHFDIQNTELITMTSRQIKWNALNAMLSTLLLLACGFELAVKKKIVFFFRSSVCGFYFFYSCKRIIWGENQKINCKFTLSLN